MERRTINADRQTHTCNYGGHAAPCLACIDERPFTFDDVRRRGLTDISIYAHLTMQRKMGMSDEQTLINMVLVLSAHNRDLQVQLIHAMKQGFTPKE